MPTNKTIDSQKNDDNSALMELLAPDGYYTYLGVTKPVLALSGAQDANSKSHTNNSNSNNNNNSVTTKPVVDEDAVKKNYRKLSLKHHPDKTGGDADVFRVLNRAQRVLLNAKLRQQYDILGIDLDDDEEDHPHEATASAADGGNHNKDTAPPSSTQGIIQEIAGTVLAGVIQLGVRTLMMGSVSVIIVRYRWTCYPALAFLAFVIYRIFQQQSRLPGGSLYDTIPPTLIAVGVLFMHSSIRYNTAADQSWNVQFWIGETIVIGMFLYNSLSFLPLRNTMVSAAMVVISLLAALLFRGNLWNYAAAIGLIAFLAIIVALGFPIMELLLEAILNEKLKKVGDKVRHHHQILQHHYETKASRRR